MGEVEEYFPRGGKKPTAKFLKPRSTFLGTALKSERKRNRHKDKHEGDDGYSTEERVEDLDLSTKHCANGISYKTVKEGLLLLARVVYASDHKVFMSLPGKMQGVVVGSNISEAYNKLIKAFVDDEIESVPSLDSMFRPGQYVAVRVEEVMQGNLGLSMMPHHVNLIKYSDIKKGTLFQAAVSSVEDHGYIMELGIPLTRAFLPKSNTNEEIKLDVGHITWCVVKSVTPSEDSTLLTLTNTLSDIQEGVMKHEPSGSCTTVLPGTAVTFYVDKALDSGIEGHIFNNTTSYIQRTHADLSKGKRPQLGQKIRPRLLYVMPTRKTPFLCSRNIFETTYPDLNEERQFKNGDVIEKAQVIKIAGRSIVFKLAKRCLGHLNKRKIAVDEDLSDEEVLSKTYPIGSEHRVRILTYNMVDYMYSVTDNAEHLDEKYFSYSDVEVGEIVSGIIQEVHDTHLDVSIGRLKGSVDIMHTSDAGIINDPKITSTVTKKKFKVGQAVKARVLQLKIEGSYLALTMKPSLLTENVTVLKSYDDAVLHQTYTGFITHVKDYILVSFFNNIRAYVPKKCVSLDPIENVADAFHVGQIVNVTIIDKRDDKKIYGSFISADQWQQRKRNNNKAKQAANTEIKTRKRTHSKTEDEGKQKEKEKAKKKKIKEETVIIRAEDERLINLDNCISEADFKKRATLIKNSIMKRHDRLKRIKTKIYNIETEGLNATNKIYHTAMQNEKIIIDERIKALGLALKEVQLKLKGDKSKQKEKGKKETKKSKKEISDNEVDSGAETENAVEDAGPENDKEDISETEDRLKESVTTIKVADESGPVLELPSVQSFWSMNADDLSKNIKEAKEEDLSTDEETTEVPKKKRKKLSAAEKVAKAREEEQRLREMEIRAIESENAPQTSDHFERALLANPNNSEMWIAYMAFYLQATEIAKARAIGKKALSTIAFREEEEKLNVWLALINIEHRFGTKETQQAVLGEALQANDTFKIHSKLLDILVETGNTDELSSLVDLMLRKYKRETQTYILCGTACYNAKMIEKARYVMQKAVSILDKKEHVSVIVQFALMERSHGDTERAVALFEQILSVFPQRVDVCSTYVDMLYKSKDIDAIRNIMEHMTSQKLPARKMKVVFKKWLEAEEKLGDARQVEKIREKAMEFIKKAQF